MAKRMPTGAKHAPCVAHVPHPYPSNGYLCLSAPEREPEMVAFADYLAAVAARRHAEEAELRSLPTDEWRQRWCDRWEYEQTENPDQPDPIEAALRSERDLPGFDYAACE